MLAVVVVNRWYPWPAVDAFIMAPSSMSCSTLWDSTMSRPALTGTTTSKSCCRMLCLVTELFIIQNGMLYCFSTKMPTDPIPTPNRQDSLSVIFI